MSLKLHKNSDGLAHVVVVLLVVLVVGAVGFVGWRVMKKSGGGDSVVDKVAQKAAEEECKKENDKDICKFLSSWEANEKYRMTSTDPTGAKSVFEIDGNKSRVVMSGEFNYEVITIDKTTYTKAGDVWYKQTIKDPEDDVAKDYEVDFDEPADKPEEEAKKTVYKSLGKEACGNLNCFKYQVIEPDSADTKEYIWFDDKDYQLRRTRTETAEGATETTFEYGNVSVKEPSPVKELDPNEVLMPGQTEPTTLPDMSQYQQ